MIDNILNLIYPPVCGICGNLDNNFLCKDCENLLKKIKCDKIDIYNPKEKIYQKHFYLFKYKTVIRKAMLDYKFNDCSYLYRTFEKILLNDKKVCEFIKSYDIIIPVPIYKKRKKERGYNQSLLVIKEFTKEFNYKYRLNLGCNYQILQKTKSTNRQSLLSKRERESNLINAYSLKTRNIEELKGKRIIIFDDIYTTGSTVYECAKTLNLANPKKIDILTIAKD